MDHIYREIDQDNYDLELVAGPKENNVIETDDWSDVQGVALAEHSHINEYLMADAYHALFSPSVELTGYGPDAAKMWWAEFFSGIGPAIRDITVEDPVMAERFATRVAGKLHAYLNDCDHIAGSDDESVGDILQRRNSLDGIQGDLAADLDEARDLKQLQLDSQDFRKTYDKTARNPRMKAILQLAGQMLRFAHGKRKERDAGVEKAGGLEYGGDLSRLIAQEYTNLTHPILKLDFLRRFAEQQAVNTRRFREDPIGRGPVVFLCDESWSMTEDNRIVQAKALACAMAQLAKQDNRWIAFCGFSSTGQQNWLIMKPDEWDNDKLLAWLEHFYSKGTDFNVLNHTALQWQQLDPPEGRTDVVFVTDGEDDLHDDNISEWETWRRASQVKCYGINIGHTNHIDKLCDESWTTHQMGLDDEPTRQILSEV